MRLRSDATTSLSRARLPLGAPNHDLSRAEGARECHLLFGHTPGNGRTGLDLRTGPRRHRRYSKRRPLPLRDLQAGQHYAGSIGRFSADIGFTREGVLIWTVFAPTTSPAPGALAGSFGGVTAGATVGVGLGANVLVDGSGSTISLQPLSIEGNTGLNVARSCSANPDLPARIDRSVHDRRLTGDRPA